MECEVTSWIPNAVAATLCMDRSAEPVISWLTSLRASIEEYDPLITIQPTTLESETDSSSGDSAFDEILSQLGQEIFKLDEYQRNFVTPQKQITISTLNIFDECLDRMTEEKHKETTNSKPLDYIAEYSDCGSTLSYDSFVTSMPGCSVKVTSDKGEGAPVPQPRTNLTSNIYDNIEFDGRRGSDASASTCWSYKDCNHESRDGVYAAVWSQSSGYHNSDKILKEVLSQNHATVSQLSFDTVDEFAPSDYAVYALHEVGDRCVDGPPVAMTPEKPDDGYEPVRDAICTDDNIYEEIEFYNTDEGCSCGSIEMESYSISASSGSMGRESPMYANMRDNDAYAIPQDVIYWKNLLQDPYYIEDEEDEWITPEECAICTREQKPPLVIPRITQYRTPRKLKPQYHEDHIPVKSRHYEKLQHNWSPVSELSQADLEKTYRKADAGSSKYGKITKKFGGSTENLLQPTSRPTHLMLPPSSAGDSLVVEMRDRSGHTRKSRSMVAPKHEPRSPVPAPRLHLHTTPEAFEPIILEGPVKRTKFSEGGKKSRKNWTDCYMILTHSALKFYKDQRTFQATRMGGGKPGTPPSPPAPRVELELPLHNAHIVHCIQMHTRRYTRSLILTIDHEQYLIQDETEEGARRWQQAIQRVIYAVYRGLDSAPSSSTDLDSLGRTPPFSRHPRYKHKAGGSSNEDLSDSTELSAQKVQVKSRLRKFFAKRPPMEVLVKKGIYKDEPVFGRSLEKVCPSTSPQVPEFVVACINEIESSEENMCTDGLYRASGNLSQVQKIRLEIDQNNMEGLENSADIHVLTGSLKLFFRELKEPLIPFKMFSKVLNACSIRPREARIKEFREIINSLPQCNRDTLEYLLRHLLKVTQYSERNRMTTANLAIVFGPTLLWAPPDRAETIAIDCIQQNNVVDILLTDFHEIFNAKDKVKRTG